MHMVFEILCRVLSWLCSVTRPRVARIAPGSRRKVSVYISTPYKSEAVQQRGTPTVYLEILEQNFGGYEDIDWCLFSKVAVAHWYDAPVWESRNLSDTYISLLYIYLIFRAAFYSNRARQ